MDADEMKILLVAIVLFLSTAVVFFVLGGEQGRHVEKTEAVKAGAARYEADPKTGAVRFVYLPRITP